MAVTYASTLRTTRMEAVRDAIASGAGTATLEVGTASMATTLVAFSLNATPTSVAGDVLTIGSTPISGTATATGTAAAARIKDKDGNVVVSGLTVATSGANVTIDNTSINSGQGVSLTSGTITHATS